MPEPDPETDPGPEMDAGDTHETDVDAPQGRVLDRGRSERVDSMIDDVEVDQELSRRLAARSGLYVPMLLRDRPS